MGGATFLEYALSKNWNEAALSTLQKQGTQYNKEALKSALFLVFNMQTDNKTLLGEIFSRILENCSFTEEEALEVIQQATHTKEQFLLKELLVHAQFPIDWQKLFNKDPKLADHLWNDFQGIADIRDTGRKLPIDVAFENGAKDTTLKLLDRQCFPGSTDRASFLINMLASANPDMDVVKKVVEGYEYRPLQKIEELILQSARNKAQISGEFDTIWKARFSR